MESFFTIFDRRTTEFPSRESVLVEKPLGISFSFRGYEGNLWHKLIVTNLLIIILFMRIVFTCWVERELSRGANS